MSFGLRLLLRVFPNVTDQVLVTPGKIRDSSDAVDLVSTASINSAGSVVAVDANAGGAGGNDADSISGTITQSGNTVNGTGTNFLTMFPSWPINTLTFSSSGTVVTSSSNYAYGGVGGQLVVGDLLGNPSVGYRKVIAISVDGTQVQIYSPFPSNLPPGTSLNRIEQPTFATGGVPGVGGPAAFITSILSDTVLTTDMSQSITTPQEAWIGAAYNNAPNMPCYMNIFLSDSNLLFASTQRTKPIKSTLYTRYYRRIGVVIYMNGAIVPFTQRGSGDRDRTYVYEAGIASENTAFVVSGAPSWARLALNLILPPTATAVQFTQNFSPSAPAAWCQWRTPNVGPAGLHNDGIYDPSTAPYVVGGQECTLDPFQAIEYMTSNPGDMPLFRIKGFTESLDS